MFSHLNIIVGMFHKRLEYNLVLQAMLNMLQGECLSLTFNVSGTLYKEKKSTLSVFFE